MLAKLIPMMEQLWPKNPMNTLTDLFSWRGHETNPLPPTILHHMDNPYVLGMLCIARIHLNAFNDKITGPKISKVYRAYGTPEAITRDDNELKCLADTMLRWGRVEVRERLRYDANVPEAILVDTLAGKPVRFSNWFTNDAEGMRAGQVYGLFYDKLFVENWPRYSSVLGYVMAWNIDQIDASHSLFCQFIRDNMEEVVQARIEKRFGTNPQKFTWNFGDWWLLYPVAMSILKDKPVETNNLNMFYKWVFRKDWTKDFWPQEWIILAAISKTFEHFKEHVYTMGKYRRSHMVKWITEVAFIHQDAIKLTRQQLGDIAPQLIKMALKKDEYKFLNKIIMEM
jgi:hypothetical protein